MADRLPRVSVVVASHGRAHWLARCLTALRQLDYPSFEVIVVADGDSLDAIADNPVTPLLRTARFDETNLSTARNVGIAAAGGRFAAFIDDDAVPEPMWLHWHIDALARTGADASVGYVRGRNGISFQSRANAVDAEAETHEVALSGEDPIVPDLPEDRVLKLVGTNALVRRDVLVALGGFDEAYRYFLEDADLSMRLSAAGYRACVAPLAEVHHGFAASPRRTALRMPRRLFEIGRSTAIYFRRHEPRDLSELKERLFVRERARLERHLVRGTCEPRDVRRLLKDLEEGWRAGQGVETPERHVFGKPGHFQPMPEPPDGHAVLSSRLLRRRSVLAEAAKIAQKGSRASVFSFSLTPVRHHVRYIEPGIWVQTGGQFGRTLRKTRLIRWCRFANRLSEDIARVAKQRGLHDIGDAGVNRKTWQSGRSVNSV